MSQLLFLQGGKRIRELRKERTSPDAVDEDSVWLEAPFLPVVRAEPGSLLGPAVGCSSLPLGRAPRGRQARGAGGTLLPSGPCGPHVGPTAPAEGKLLAPRVVSLASQQTSLFPCPPPTCPKAPPRGWLWGSYRLRNRTFALIRRLGIDDAGWARLPGGHGF